MLGEMLKACVHASRNHVDPKIYTSETTLKPVLSLPKKG